MLIVVLVLTVVNVALQVLAAWQRHEALKHHKRNTASATASATYRRTPR